jgi:uncharacterized phage protein gp47/JayE
MTTPTTAQLSANIVASISAAISQTVPLLPRSFVAVLAKALAAVLVILYKRADFIGLQWFVATASTAPTTFNGQTVVPLIEIGRQIGVGDPTVATQAELVVSISVQIQTGSLPPGTQIIGANGVTYLLIGSVLLDASTVSGTFRAASDQSGGDGAGAIGNLPVSSVLSFANPLPNVARNVTVTSVSVVGANAENLDIDYRRRVLDRWQKRPQGGALADYEQWAETVPGVINVYPYTGEDPGEVDLYSEATVASSGSPDGIPTAPQLAAVLAAVNFDEAGLASRRPANAFVNSLPITRTHFDVVVDGLADVADPAQVQDDIEAAVEAYFLAAEPYINGLTVPPRRDRLTRSALIGVVDDIVSAANGTFTTATFEVVGGSPVETYTLDRGEKAMAESVAFS